MFNCQLSALEYVNAASYHKDSNGDFIRKANLLLKSKPFEITTGCSEFGNLIKKRGNAVIREVHLLSAYMRLKPYPEMILEGECNPEHDNSFLIAKSLAKKFDKFIILVFTKNTFSVVTNRIDLPEFPTFEVSSKAEVISRIRDFAKKSIKEHISEEIILKDGDYLWEKYYETQFLEQRLNVKLFRKFIPKNVIDKAYMKLEKEFYKKNVEQRKEKYTLDSFFY